jgi:hypothetical protein
MQNAQTNTHSYLLNAVPSSVFRKDLPLGTRKTNVRSNFFMKMISEIELDDAIVW